MTEPWYIYLLAFAGAFVAGSINTLAGSGSVITLSILTELLGLPGNVANGTNRIGVLFNGFGSTWGFYKGGKLSLSGARHVLVPIILGAFVGIGIAVSISNEQFMGIFKFLMILMLFVILVKPGRWLKKSPSKRLVPSWLLFGLYFVLGIYAGLIQMGMGIFFLAVIVLLDGYRIIEANAIKVAVVTMFTIVAVVIFELRGLIEWDIGLLMGAGQFTGGWITARMASRHPRAEQFAYAVLVIIVIVSLLSLFDIF